MTTWSGATSALSTEPLMARRFARGELQRRPAQEEGFVMAGAAAFVAVALGLSTGRKRYCIASGDPISRSARSFLIEWRATDAGSSITGSHIDSHFTLLIRKEHFMDRVLHRAVVVTTLVLTLGTTPGWGSPPNNDVSDWNWNTAGGSEALYSNSTGSSNTAFGGRALRSNSFGSDNTATGHEALYLNTTGGSNTASGVRA